MKKPDRYDKMVDGLVGNADGVQRFGITNAGAAALLRRQHVAYVKMVKAEMALAKGQCYAEQRGDALNGLLAAFARYQKGTR